ncbi:MAG TPA: dihydrodipicolinate synthase family protein, partial [Gemmatimonadaceae bacterium]|nr:dihydrodipicolinate synthase family protein [Gemmatimonadaceae bacterium]
MSITLQGILGPVVTTFQAGSGDVDRTAFTNNIRAHLAAGLHGVVVTGSTGEAPLLEERERAALIEVARDVIPPDRLLIAGTGAESTRACLRLTQLAAQRGADAVLVVAPHYYGANAMTAAALRGHYLEIADRSPVPVALYSIPKYMHFSLGPQLVAELALHENIVGIKDSSGDLDLLSAYLNAQTERFTVLTGNGSTLQQALRMGARGGVLAVSLFAPALALEVYEAMRRGGAEGVAAAERAQRRLTPLNARIVAELGVAGVKAALDHVGLEGGPTRAPLLPLGAPERAQVA